MHACYPAYAYANVKYGEKKRKDRATVRSKISTKFKHLPLRRTLIRSKHFYFVHSLFII